MGLRYVTIRTIDEGTYAICDYHRSVLDVWTSVLLGPRARATDEGPGPDDDPSIGCAVCEAIDERGLQDHDERVPR